MLSCSAHFNMGDSALIAMESQRQIGEEGSILFYGILTETEDEMTIDFDDAAVKSAPDLEQPVIE